MRSVWLQVRRILARHLVELHRSAGLLCRRLREAVGRLVVQAVAEAAGEAVDAVLSRPLEGYGTGPPAASLAEGWLHDPYDDGEEYERPLLAGEEEDDPCPGRERRARALRAGLRLAAGWLTGRPAAGTMVQAGMVGLCAAGLAYFTGPVGELVCSVAGAWLG